MSLLTKMRKQNAVYWPPSTLDEYGRPQPGELIPLILLNGVNYRVRWEDAQEQLSSSSSLGLGGPTSEGDVGSTVNQTKEALVYVGVLPSGAEVQVGGFLWLGDSDDLVSGNVIYDTGGNPVLDDDGNAVRTDDQADPRFNGAREIKTFKKLPNLKNSEYLRTCTL